MLKSYSVSNQVFPSSGRRKSTHRITTRRKINVREERAKRSFPAEHLLIPNTINRSSKGIRDFCHCISRARHYFSFLKNRRLALRRRVFFFWSFSAWLSFCTSRSPPRWEGGGGGQKANQAVDEELEVGGQATTHVERLRLFG